MRKFILLITGILLAVAALANGGGVYAVSSVTGSGNPVFRDIHDIYIISEKLDIKLIGPRSEITVKYLLWNNSDKDYNSIDYGFPVDYIKYKEVEDDYNSKTFQWKDSYIQSIDFRFENEALTYKASEGKPLPNEDVLYKGYKNIYRKWFYTQFSIKRNSIVSLEVRYSLENQYITDGYSPVNYEIQDFKPFYKLQYDFSPASHWGDGIIRDFNITIDTRDLLLKEDYSLNTAQEEMPRFEGLELEDNGNGIYTCNIRNFNLNNVNPLIINYRALYPSAESMLKNRISNSDFTILSSKNTEKYPVSNLTDVNLETAWMAKGVGDWIEFHFKQSQSRVAGFTLVNGYNKNEKTYYENNRIKKLKIEINERIDNSDEYPDWGILKYDDIPYHVITFDNIFNTVIYYDLFDDIIENEKIKKIRFTVLEVYEGSKYDDTCISEIILYK